MTKKEANARMRAKYRGQTWWEIPGAIEERNALMRGGSAPKPSKPPSKQQQQRPREKAVKATRSSLKPGMLVSFQHRGKTIKGYVEKKLPKNIRVKTPGGSWRVSPGALTILGGEVEGLPVWRVSPREGKLNYYKQRVATGAYPPNVVGIAEAKPRAGRSDFGWWPFTIVKTAQGYTSPDFDFPEHKGPHATLDDVLAAVREDAWATGT